MVKKMGLNWRQWSLHKHNHLLVRVAVSLLLMGLAFRLLFVHSTVPEAPFVEKPVIASAPVILNPPVSEEIQVTRDPNPAKGDQIWLL